MFASWRRRPGPLATHHPAEPACQDGQDACPTDCPTPSTLAQVGGTLLSMNAPPSSDMEFIAWPVHSIGEAGHRSAGVSDSIPGGGCHQPKHSRDDDHDGQRASWVERPASLDMDP